ncbi:hypothetical protein BD769DRAFT_1390857 [Suillus cothurnatus]|nr:hypothetical protein BD769DRAFT_1390857 [Suillus cothurnatus]
MVVSLGAVHATCEWLLLLGLRGACHLPSLLLSNAQASDFSFCIEASDVSFCIEASDVSFCIEASDVSFCIEAADVSFCIEDLSFNVPHRVKSLIFFRMSV